MRKVLIVVITFVAMLVVGLNSASAQRTHTNCTVSGSDVSCDSSTTPNPADVVRQQQNDNWQAFKDGYNNPAARQLGAALAFKARVHKYCKLHRGETWTFMNPAGEVVASGVCN